MINRQGQSWLEIYVHSIGKLESMTVELGVSLKLEVLVEDSESAKGARGKLTNSVSQLGRECFKMKGVFKSGECC